VRGRRLVEPPSTAAWAIDAELNGHTVAQTLAYMSDCADWADLQDARARRPADFVIVADTGPSLLPRWLRRRARRAARG